MAGPDATNVLTRIVGLAGAALAMAALIAVFLVAQRPPDGPVEVPLDRVKCAHCGMLVSEASFAGQLHTQAGEVLFYDDPGCLLLDADARAAEVRALWFHAHEGPHWLSSEEVAFERVESTPMGYGLAARPRGEGALERVAALEIARARAAARAEPSP